MEMNANPRFNESNPMQKAGEGGISSIYQSWKVAQFEEEEKELLNNIKALVLDDTKELTMFQQLQISNILLWGVEKVRGEVTTSWQNQGAVAGFIGAIAFSILLNALDKSIGFDNDEGLVLHVTFALTEANFLTFLLEWELVIRLPEVLTTVGCYSMVIASCLGVFVITDTYTGFFVAIIAIVMSILATVLWLRMIAKNVKMGKDSSKRIMDSFRDRVKSQR